MRTSGRLLATIALIALLLAPAVPAAAEPGGPASWQDLLQQVETWLGRLLAPIADQPVGDAEDRGTTDARPEHPVSLPPGETLSTRQAHDEIFPGMDPDG